jgi:hypothetical protein
LVGHLDCVWHLHSWRRPQPIRIPSHMGTSLRQFESCYSCWHLWGKVHRTGVYTFFGGDWGVWRYGHH